MNQEDKDNFPILTHTSSHFLITYTVYKVKDGPTPMPYVLLKHIIGKASFQPLRDCDFAIAFDDLEKMNDLMMDQGFIAVAPTPGVDPPEILMSYI